MADLFVQMIFLTKIKNKMRVFVMALRISGFETNRKFQDLNILFEVIGGERKSEKLYNQNLIKSEKLKRFQENIGKIMRNIKGI